MQPSRFRSEPSTGRRSARERRARERRVLGVGLTVSLVVHLIALALLGGMLQPQPRTRSAPEAPVLLAPPTGLRAVDIAVREGAAPNEPRPPSPRSTPTPTRAAVGIETDTTVATRERLAADDITAAEWLAPRVVDPRLWEPMVIIPREPTIEDVEARLGAAIELLSDSALADTERKLRARDWTVQDGKGGRWGISPGKLHLGKLTLPLPIWFPTDPGVEAENELWYDLEAQVDRAKFLESFEDRVRAIRERREQERREAKAAEDGGG